MLKAGRLNNVFFTFIGVIFLIFTVFARCAAYGYDKLPPPQGVKVNVLRNMYISPAAELRTTKTYPDVIIIENEYIKVSLVPNRGRLIFDYLFKPTGNAEIYTNTKPSPTKTPAGYVMEFGGYYLSVPWNQRARQPYDLEYKIVEESPDKAKVYLWGEDSITHAFVEIWLTEKQYSSLIEIKIKISNPTKKDISFKFSDFIIINPGGELSENSAFIIPTAEVKVGQNKNNWMGEEGTLKNWPQVWTNWGSFSQFGSFSTEVNEMSAPFWGMINYATGDTFIKIWEPAYFFDVLKIWTWGSGYKNVKRATPTANFENYKENISLPPGSSVSFSTYFYALKDMQNITMANKNFAGWIETDKEIYRIGEDESIKIQSGIGTSGNYKNIKAVVFLTDYNGSVVKQIIGKQINLICPLEPHKISSRMKLENIVRGIYILRLKIFDTKGNIIFVGDSLPFTVE